MINCYTQLFNSDVNIGQQTVKHRLNKCMTDQTSKAIGLRVPAPLWAKIQDHGLANHPKGESFDVTQTLVTLLANALDIPLDSIVKQPSSLSDERITAIVKQEFDRLAVELMAEVKASTSNEYVQKNSWDDLRADVADLRQTLTELKTDNDMSAASIKRLIREAISETLIDTHTNFDPAAIQIYIDQQIDKLRAQITATGTKPASIGTTRNPGQKAKPATAPGEPNNEVVKVANRLEREPELKAAVINALSAGHTGEALGQYLADKGFMNSNGGKYTGASNSRFRLAIEHLNSINGA
jgi:hypothetical protein